MRIDHRSRAWHGWRSGGPTPGGPTPASVPALASSVAIETKVEPVASRTGTPLGPGGSDGSGGGLSCGASVRAGSTATTTTCGCSSVAEHQLPKLRTRVRLSSPAPHDSSLFPSGQDPVSSSITFASPDLVDLEHEPGQDVLIEFPQPSRTTRRRDTIRCRCPVRPTGAPRLPAAGAHEDGHDDPMPSSPARARRGRGRPRKSEGLETAQALLDAAAEVCAEWGFDGTTIARVAARGGVTPAAIYNHYESREELLYASAVQGLERITTLSLKLMGAPDATPALASAYLRPEMRVTRRLLAELHLASGRDERLAELLAGWHRSWAKAMTAQLPADDPSAAGDREGDLPAAARPLPLRRPAGRAGAESGGRPAGGAGLLGARDVRAQLITRCRRRGERSRRPRRRRSSARSSRRARGRSATTR